jgi:hypothetical protein
MIKKGIKCLVLVFILLAFIGCSSEKLKIVKDPNEIKPGTLTKENVSLAGIHIGDSQEQVLKLYGEPNKKEQIHSTPFLGWYYDDLGLLVAFYRKGEREPIEGVVDIQISEPSKLTTNSGIRIGDSLESIVNRYNEAYWSIGLTKITLDYEENQND